MTLLECQGIKRDQYQLLRELPADKAIKVEFKEVQHADDMKAYGMILSSPDEKIYYSGDAAYLLEEIESMCIVCTWMENTMRCLRKAAFPL